jgi:hypothetical protein
MSSFTYSNISERSIRLLSLNSTAEANDDQLRCTLMEASLESAPEYDAISYAWNDEQPTVPIACNNHILLITNSLHNALRTMRDVQRPRPLWADAICINQTDDTEKAMQVSLMETIYSSAHTVIVWLGPAGPYTDLAMRKVSSMNEALKRLKDGKFVFDKDLLRYGLPDCHDKIWHGIDDVFTRRWFTRLWTIQEVARASRLVVYCGLVSANWDIFSSLAEALAIHGLRGVAHVYHRSAGRGLFELDGYSAMRLPNQIMEAYYRGKWISLETLVFNARKWNTSEAVDKIYAILGLTDPELRRQIKIDYSLQNRHQFWNLYISFGHLILQERPDLGMLMQVSSTERHAEMPSWCLNLEIMPQCVDWEFNQYEAGGYANGFGESPHIASSLDKKCITLRGIMIDEVAEVVQTDWQFDAVQKARGVRKSAAQTLMWMSECKRIYERTSLSYKDSIEAFVRCLVADTFRFPKIHVPDLEELEEGYAALNVYLRRLADQVAKPLTNDQMCLVQKYLDGIDSTCRHRKIFRTRGGRFGVGPLLIKPGDRVCVFRTTKMPLILRKEHGQEFNELHGAAYVYGIMHGEALEMEEQGLVHEEHFEIA